MMDIILLIGLNIVFAVLVIIILCISDKSTKYKYISVLLLIPIIILEFPHYLLPDPTKLIDIFTHIASGLGGFMAVSNFRWIRKNQRARISFFITVMVILGVELFLSILELTMGYPNPIGFNIVEDIIWHIVGGVMGLGIYYYLHRKERIFIGEI